MLVIGLCLLKALLWNTLVPHTKESPSSLHSRTQHDVFHSFFYDNSKQDADTIYAKRKIIIELLKKKCLGTGFSTIWDHIYGCAENYIWDTDLYLLSILLQSYNIIIDNGISAPGHEREVVYGLNATYKMFIFFLMATVQLPGSKRFNTQMEVHTATQNY